MGGVGVVGEVVAGEDLGGGVGQAAGHGASGREVGGGFGGLQGYGIGQVHRAAGAVSEDLDAVGDLDIVAAVDVAEGPAADIEAEVLVGGVDRGCRGADARHAEDLADEVQVAAGGVVEKRLSEIQGVVVL